MGAAITRTGPSSMSKRTFAVQYALTELLRSWGLAPTALLGYGCGEFAAACAHGEISVEHALERVAHRVRQGPSVPGESQRLAAAPTEFLTAVRALHEQGHRVFLEIGHALGLRDMARQVLPDGGYLWLSTLLPGVDDWTPLLETVAALHCHGVAVNWSGFDRDYPRRKVALPLYPFEREPVLAGDCDPGCRTVST